MTKHVSTKEYDKKSWSIKQERNELEISSRSDEDMITISIYEETPVGMFDCTRSTNMMTISFEEAKNIFEKVLERIQNLK